MTCIVGVVKKGKVVIGGDSAGVAGYALTIRKDPKVFRNGKFLVGCTSSFRMIQILRFGFKPPKIEKELYEYMCTDFVDAIRQSFEAGGYLQKTSEGDERGGSFLVGVQGRLFSIGSDFQVGENIDGFDAIGCGGEYALGSLHSTSGNPAKRVKKALKAAANFSAGVSAPFLIEDI